jgi:hypothetical protein
VTGSAIGVGNTGIVSKGKRLMGLMTLDTVFKLLAFDMYFMAVQAVWFVAVFIVTERAGKSCMRSGV